MQGDFHGGLNYLTLQLVYFFLQRFYAGEKIIHLHLKAIHRFFKEWEIIIDCLPGGAVLNPMDNQNNQQEDNYGNEQRNDILRHIDLLQ